MTMQSENINELLTALSKAQREMSFAVKDSTNPHFRSRYADLGAVWEACREPLSKHGLSVIQSFAFEGEKQVLVSILGHTSGQWIKSAIALPVQKPGPQELGSCTTYCRRYALAALVGIYQDDDDGERAEKPYRETKHVAPATQPIVKLNEEQKKAIEEYVKLYPDAMPWLKDKYNINEIKDLNANVYEFLVNVFEKRKKQGA